MRMINLLPKSEQKETQLQFFSRSQSLFWFWTVMTMVLFLGATFGARFYLNSIHKQTENQIAVKQRSLQTSDNEQLRTEVDTLNQQIRLIRNLQKEHIYWSAAFEELGNLFTADMTIDLISVDRETGKVDILGGAASRDNVIAFWSALHKSEYFKNINFPLANLERANNSNFTFTFYIDNEKLKEEPL